MDKPLEVYLRDHFAGSRLAVDLLRSLRDRHKGEPVSEFADELLEEVEYDRSVLKGLIESVGAGRLGALKEGLAYASEKLTWLKLRRAAAGGLGTLESLETIALGIQGKLALWRTLELIKDDERLTGIDFGRMAARAEDQHARVEKHRLDVARRIL